MTPDLRVNLGSLPLRNPVMVAAGTFGYGLEYRDLVDLSQLGAIVTKSLTLAPRMGNLPPRVAETPAGMLNAIGLQNDGVDAFVLETLPACATTERRLSRASPGRPSRSMSWSPRSSAVRGRRRAGAKSLVPQSGARWNGVRR